MKLGFRSLGLTLALGLLFGFASPSQAEASYRVVNLVDEFMAYYQAARDLNAQQRAGLWDQMLEQKHTAFFNDAIYRRFEGSRRERYKASCLEVFWREIAPHMEYYRRLNQSLPAIIKSTLRDFQKVVPDYTPRTSYYVCFSFSFRGKAVQVGDQAVLALGLEHFREFGDGAERQIRITLAHEMFHLYHYQFFSTGGGLYRPLWAEGLATYASALTVPGYRFSTYLGFTGQKMNQCHDMLPLLAADLLKNLGNSDHRLRRIYFGAEPNPTRVPPEAGYYVGVLMVANLVKEYRLTFLARLEKDQVFKVCQKELNLLVQGR